MQNKIINKMLVIPIRYKITLHLKTQTTPFPENNNIILSYLAKYSSSQVFTGPCLNNFHQVIFNIRDVEPLNL